MSIAFLKTLGVIILSIAVISFVQRITFLLPFHSLTRDYSFVIYLFGGLTAGILICNARLYWGLYVWAASFVFERVSAFITLHSIATGNKLKPMPFLDYILSTVGFVSSPIYGYESGFKITILIKDLILPICFSLIGCEIGYLLQKKLRGQAIIEKDT